MLLREWNECRVTERQRDKAKHMNSPNVKSMWNVCEKYVNSMFYSLSVCVSFCLLLSRQLCDVTSTKKQQFFILPMLKTHTHTNHHIGCITPCESFSVIKRTFQIIRKEKDKWNERCSIELVFLNTKWMIEVRYDGINKSLLN